MRGISILALAWCAAGAAQAEVYRCTDAAGHRQYQDQPCSKDANAAVLDLSVGNLTTIDSEAARREAQGALELREQVREAHAPSAAKPLPADARQVDAALPYEAPFEAPYNGDDRGYPVYLPWPDRHHGGHDHHHDHTPPHPDDSTTTQRPRRTGGNHTLPPPTIQQVAPRPPRTTTTRRPPEDER